MIASVGAVCDLDLVVIGGGVAKSGALLFDPLREALSTYAGLDFIAGYGCWPPNSAVTRAWSARRPARRVIRGRSPPRGLALHMLSAPIAQTLKNRPQRHAVLRDRIVHARRDRPRVVAVEDAGVHQFVQVADQHPLGDLGMLRRSSAVRIGRPAVAAGSCPSAARR